MRERMLTWLVAPLRWLPGDVWGRFWWWYWEKQGISPAQQSRLIHDAELRERCPRSVGVDALRSYLQQPETRLEEWVSAALRSGMTATDYEWDASDLESFDTTLLAAGVVTADGLDAELVAAWPQAEGLLSPFARAVAARGEPFAAVGPDVLAAVVALRKGTPLAAEFSDSVHDALEDTRTGGSSGCPTGAST